MSARMDRIVKSMSNVLRAADNSPVPYDTQAEVVRVDGDTAWVHIAGGVAETPVKMTINARPGDTVQVRVSGGSAWLTGNGTAPPTDDQKAIEAGTKADVASEAAQQAITEAERAGAAADSAVAYADEARQAADDAQDSADEAQASARNASDYAARALGNLSTVQSVAETLNWITAHGTMTLTTDMALDPTHVYFVQDANGDYVVGNVHYSVVTEPDVADISTYYELTIDESLNNYVGTHLALTGEGLWLIPEASGGNRILIATGSGQTYTEAGTYIIDENDNISAQFLEDGLTVYAPDGTLIAHLGYGDGASETGTEVEAPYYTFGRRKEATDVFDPTVTYYAGDLCLYGGWSYMCKVVNTTGAWDSTHWRRLIGNYSVAEGINCSASGTYSHAEGNEVKANGNSSHAEGKQTTASGTYSHAEGYDTFARLSCDHAEGSGTIARGSNSHAEGEDTLAQGECSHAEGSETTASGRYSHAGGHGTLAYFECQTAIGKYNDCQKDTLFEIGNGNASEPSNAFTVDKHGHVELALDTSAASGTVDGDLYAAITALGWGSEVIG